MPTIEGFEVFEIQPDFADAPRLVGQRGHRLVEHSAAARIAAYPGKHAKHVLAHTFLCQSKAEIDALEDFFYARAGRWQPFWMPSWHGELNPVATIPAAGTSLSITPVDYANVFLPADNETFAGSTFTNYGRFRLGRHLWLYRRDGTSHYSRVDAATSADPEVLTLASAVATEFTLGEFVVGFLYFVRFLNDKIEFEFEGPTAARAKLSMVEVVRITSPADA